MSKNDFSTKLAEGIRRAKNEPDAKSVSTSASKQTAATARPARKPDTSSTPKSTTDQPWENLHPTRIWPD